MGGVLNLTHFDLMQQFWDALFGLAMDNGETILPWYATEAKQINATKYI